MGEKAFTKTGFQNWLKAMEKFSVHDGSQYHREAKVKLMSKKQATISAHLSSQATQLKAVRREGFVALLRAVRFLTCQGIAIRYHTEVQGNLYQLLRAWSADTKSNSF